MSYYLWNKNERKRRIKARHQWEMYRKWEGRIERYRRDHPDDERHDMVLIEMFQAERRERRRRNKEAKQ